MSKRWPARVSGVREAAELAQPTPTTPVELTPGRRGAPKHCGWCGRRLPEGGNVGRRRRYCGQSCRQRAYERRSAVQRGGLPEDAVVLSAAELADLQDRLFQLRCAAEDVVTAADDGAGPGELKNLAAAVVENAHGLERLR
jgi:hypothetical protein